MHARCTADNIKDFAVSADTAASQLFVLSYSSAGQSYWISFSRSYTGALTKPTSSLVTSTSWGSGLTTSEDNNVRDAFLHSTYAA